MPVQQPFECASKSSGLSWKLLVRLLISAAILGYLGFTLDWDELWKQLKFSEPVWLILATLLIGFSFLLASLRWWWLLRVQKIFLPIRMVIALTFIGQFFNSFLLGTTGGDLVKIVYILRHTPQKKTPATLSILIDRVMGLFVLICFALIALTLQMQPLLTTSATQSMTFVLFSAFAMILTGAIVVGFIPFHHAPPFIVRLWKNIPFISIVEGVVAAFRLHGASWGLTLAAVLCSGAIYFVVFVASYCLALAISIDVSFVQIVVILSIVVCVISLPISIGGHGVREGAFVIMFATFNLTGGNGSTDHGQEMALAFSFLFFLTYLIWSVVGGLAYLSYRRPVESHLKSC